jgi:hypothetical protein
VTKSLVPESLLTKSLSLALLTKSLLKLRTEQFGFLVII